MTQHQTAAEKVLEETFAHLEKVLEQEEDSKGNHKKKRNRSPEPDSYKDPPDPDSKSK